MVGIFGTGACFLVGREILVRGRVLVGGDYVLFRGFGAGKVLQSYMHSRRMIY